MFLLLVVKADILIQNKNVYPFGNIENKEEDFTLIWLLALIKLKVVFVTWT